MNPARLTLDNPAFEGRLRYIHRRPAYVRRPAQYISTQTIQDVVFKPKLLVGTQPMQQEVAIAPAPVLVAPIRLVATEKTRLLAAVTDWKHILRFRLRVPKPQQLVLYAMATVLFVVGVAVSLNGFRANGQVAAQVKQLQASSSSKKSSSTGQPAAPSTTPISSSTLASYHVAADLPRYITIPKIGVNARVLQTGVTSTGAVGTPANVFDTAWYTGSAKPGKPGATFIDGHVSSWTTNGVFYNLKKLVAGDIIVIERGDGTKINYTVVKTQTYNADKVDMAAAMTPIDTSKSGLNLMTCTGDVKAGTSEFNQRILVFAVQS